MEIKKQHPSLDAIRTIAAISVIFAHTFGIHKLEVPSYLSFTHSMAYSVQFFFVLSCYSLLLSNQFTSIDNVRSYYIKRVFRIAPLFYVFIAAYDYLYYNRSLIDRIINYSLAFEAIKPSANVVWAGWTIGVEAVFYLLLPIFYMISKTKGARLSALAAIIAGSFLFHLATYIADPKSTYYQSSFAANMGCFAFGAIVYELRDSIPQSAKWKYFLLSGAALVMVAAYFRLYDYLPALFHNARTWYGLSAALLIAAEIARPSVFLNGRFWTWAADLTYGIYLWHPLVIYNLKAVFLSIIAVFGAGGVAFLSSVILSIGLTVTLAFVTFRVIEKPMIAVGRRVARGDLRARSENV